MPHRWRIKSTDAIFFRTKKKEAKNEPQTKRMPMKKSQPNDNDAESEREREKESGRKRYEECERKINCENK